MADVVEVLQHWLAGRSIRELSSSLGMGRVRVRAIIRTGRAAGLAPGAALSRDEIAARVTPGYAEQMAALSDRERDLVAFHEDITTGLGTNNVRTVWQRLRDERGLRVGETTFRRYVRKHIRTVGPEQVTVRKPLALPGTLAEVDYGLLGRWPDPVSGKLRPVQGFTMTLAHSRRIFVRPVLRCDEATWTRCHVEAFAFFGGVPHTIRLDNLKTGVIKADIYDPSLNRSYAELGQHYGVLLDPCRAAKPKDKPQVERAVPYVRESFWKGRDFSHQGAMTEAADLWTRTVADLRPHRHLPGTVGEVFTASERPALNPLPRDPFEMATWARAVVHPDCHVQVDRRFYSVPWRLVGKKLDVRVGERLVTIYDAGTLVKTHVRERGERRYSDPADFPEEKIAFLQRTPSWCRRRAAEIGEHAGRLVDDLIREPMPLSRLRQAQAIIRLSERYPAARLDAACAMALETDAGCRTVENILKAGLDQRSADADPPMSNAGAYLHGEQVLLEGLS